MHRSTRNDTLLTVKEVAKILHSDENTVRHWIRNGLVTYVALPMNTQKPAYRLWSSTVERLAENTVA